VYILKLFLNDSSVRSKELKLSKESKVFTVLPLPFPAFLFLFRRSLLDHLVPDEEALEVTDPLKSRGQVVGGNAEVALRVRRSPSASASCFSRSANLGANSISVQKRPEWTFDQSTESVVGRKWTIYVVRVYLIFKPK